MQKAVVWQDFKKIKLIEKEEKEVLPGEIKIKVESCAICGSDLRTFRTGNERVQSGQTIGHEIAGFVCEIGTQVTKFKVGDHVAVGADVPCGECEDCRMGRGNCCHINYAIGHQFEGGFSQYMILNEITCRFGPISKFLPPLSFDKAALAEPLACCLNGFERSHVEENQSFVIFGSGPIGMMLASLAKVYKAKEIFMIDPNKKRLEKAKSLGLGNYFVHSKDIDPVDFVMRTTKNKGVDRVFTACSALASHKEGVLMLGKRGVINFFGGLPKDTGDISLNSNFIHYNELSLTGSHGSTPLQHKKALRLIEEGKIDVNSFITHRYSIDQIEEAYDMAFSGEAIKVMIKPNL